MIGYWLTYQAEVWKDPHVPDVTPYLVEYMDALRAHPEVAEAVLEHNPTSGRITIHLRIRHALTPDFALLRGRIAVHESLRHISMVAAGSPGVAPSATAQLWIDTWPDSIRRG